MSDHEVSAKSLSQNEGERPTSVPLVSESSSRPRRRWLLPALAVVVLGGILSGLLVWQLDQPERPPTKLAVARPEPTVAAPIALIAEAKPFHVTLKWVQPSEGPAVSGYDVYRNGVLHTSRRSASTTFRDTDALPGQRYRYEIEAFSGSTRSERVAVRVITPKAPLGAARLEGTYDVRAKVESSYGIDDFPARPTFAWSLQPKCQRGSCPVTLRIRGFNDIRVSLARQAARYQGSDSGRFSLQCRGTQATSSVRIELNVEKADTVLGDWMATKLSGTLTQSDAAQLGCVASGATLSFTARLVP
jgi:hypothetical protein